MPDRHFVPARRLAGVVRRSFFGSEYVGEGMSRTTPTSGIRFRLAASSPARPLHGVSVSSPARSWTLRSSAADDGDPLCCERREMRTTWRMPPQAQGVEDGPWGAVGASP